MQSQVLHLPNSRYLVDSSRSIQAHHLRTLPKMMMGCASTSTNATQEIYRSFRDLSTPWLPVAWFNPHLVWGRDRDGGGRSVVRQAVGRQRSGRPSPPGTRGGEPVPGPRHRG